jgi:hypothetical protein
VSELMGAPTEERHVAKRWVEEHFPSAAGTFKGSLILAYGAGVDRGTADALDAVAEIAEELRAAKPPEGIALA